VVQKLKKTNIDDDDYHLLRPVNFIGQIKGSIVNVLQNVIYIFKHGGIEST
jgi:hypothetical protein